MLIRPLSCHLSLSIASLNLGFSLCFNLAPLAPVYLAPQPQLAFAFSVLVIFHFCFLAFSALVSFASSALVSVAPSASVCFAAAQPPMVADNTARAKDARLTRLIQRY